MGTFKCITHGREELTLSFKFLSLRKTLEANMQMTELYPPGRVFWALWNKDLHPSNQRASAEAGLRLFRVKKVDKVFSQIVFARDMLR